MERALSRQTRPDGVFAPVELAFYGADLWQLPRAPRTLLLDAAEREVRRGRASGVRVSLAPPSVLRAPLGEFKARGVRAVEVLVHSVDRSVLRELGARYEPRLGPEAVGRLHRSRLRSIVHVQPGLPRSSHRSAMRSAELLLKARPSAVRILPALALSGTVLGEAFLAGRWRPMELSEALVTCKHLVRRFREGGTEVIRVGLQPRSDLPEPTSVLAGPHHCDLRFLVESELLRLAATRALTSRFAFGTRAFTFVVNPRDESFFRGPENSTLRQLRGQFRLERIVLIPLEEQPRGTLRVFPGELVQSEIPSLGRRRAS